ncbi:GAD-like domain-containing protein [Streptococcus fryi]
MSPEVIEKYSSQVPEELVQIWKEYGVGTFLNDYLKIINPDDYKEFVEETYFRGKESIPVLVTAFGDVITWQQNEFLGQVKYKESDFELFMEDIVSYLFEDGEGFLEVIYVIDLQAPETDIETIRQEFESVIQSIKIS